MTTVKQAACAKPAIRGHQTTCRPDEFWTVVRCMWWCQMSGDGDWPQALTCTCLRDTMYHHALSSLSQCVQCSLSLHGLSSETMPAWQFTMGTVLMLPYRAQKIRFGGQGSLPQRSWSCTTCASYQYSRLIRTAGRYQRRMHVGLMHLTSGVCVCCLASMVPICLERWCT